MADKSSMKDLLSAEDQKWYEAECKRVTEMTGYRLTMRDSGINALRMFLISEKNYPVEEAATLTEMDPGVLKGLLEEMFKAYADPDKTPQENIRNIGRIHKNAIDKIAEVPIPDADEIKSVADLEKTRKLEEALGSMQIDFTQDLQNLKDSPKDISFKEAYYEGTGGVADFENKLGKWGVFSQGIGGFRAHLYDGRYSNKSKAAAFDVYRKKLKAYQGKKIADLPSNAAGLYVNQFSLGVMSISQFVVGEKNVETPEYDAFLAGESATYPGQDKMDKLLDSLVAETAEVGRSGYEGAMTELTQKNMQLHLAEVPEFDGSETDLLKLPEETQSKMIQAYHATFGEVYKDTLLLAITQQDLDQFDFIYTGDQKTIRGKFGEKYKDYTPAQQDKALMLETMRALIKDPVGVSCSYLTVTPTKISVSVPVNVSADVSSIRLGNTVNAADAFDYKKNPGTSGTMYAVGKDIKIYIDNFFSEQKETLERHGLDKYDAIFVGDRTLNEIFEEEYADRFPAIDDTTKENVMCAILAAESFEPTTPIFATVITDNELGFMSKKAVPLSFSGKKIFPGQDRNANKEEIKKQADKILESRTALANTPEDAETDALERAENSVSNGEMRPEFDATNLRLDTIKQRAALFDPVSREFLKRTLTKMEELDRDGAVKKAGHECNVYLRAAKLTENPALKVKYEAEAQKILSSSPLTDYEKYLEGLEYAYGIKKVGSVRDIPADLQSFFEKNTGNVIPGFGMAGGDLAATASYRPMEISLNINGACDAQKVNNLIYDVYEIAKFCPEENGDVNEFILVGGKTLKELLHKSNMGEEGRAKIILDAMKNGTPVDFYVADARKYSYREISNIPIHVVPQGTSYANLDPKKTQAQKDFFDKTDWGMKKKIRTEESFVRRELRMAKHAARDYDNYWKTECYISPDKDQAATIYAMYATYYLGGMPKVGKSLPGKLTDEEAEKLADIIQPMRAVPVNYIFCKLAAESVALQKEGKPGYTVDEIVSVNALADRKREIAAEFLRVCDENDVETYFKTLKSGMDAMTQIVYNEEALKKAVQSDAAMDEAFLGKKVAFTAAMLDAKQEMEQEKGLDYQVKIGLFENKQQALDYYFNISNITAVGESVQGKKVFERCISSGAKGPEEGIFKYQRYEFVKNTVAEKVMKGEDPYKGLIMDANAQKDLADSEVFDAVPVFRNALTEDNQDTMDKIADGKFMDSFEIDYVNFHKAVADADLKKAASHVKIVNEGEKEVNYKKRLAEAAKAGFDKRLEETSQRRRQASAIKSGGESGIETGTVDEIYETLFRPLFDNPDVKEYLEQNPDKNEFDLIRVGGYSLNEWSAKEDSKLDMKTLVLQCISNPQIPLGYMDVIKNPQTGEFVTETTRAIIDNSNVERLALERPYLKTFEGFKSWFGGRFSDLNISGFDEEDWRELYERELNIAANEAPIPDDIIKTEAQLRAGTDAANPQEMALNYIETIYGADQSFVTDWAGDESGVAAVYTKDVFQQNYIKRKSGDFSNKEFAVLSYFVSMDPDVVTGDVCPEIKEEYLSRSKKLEGTLNRWTSDIRTYQHFQPRPGIMLENMGLAVTPARQAAEEGIAELAEGDPSKLAKSLAVGIRTALSSAKMLATIDNPQGDFAHWAEMLKQLNIAIDSNETLKNSVLDKLTPEEKKQMKAVIKMKELMDEAERARLSLASDGVEGRVLSDEEKRAYTETIANFGYYTKLWSDSYNEYAEGKEYIKRVEAFSKQKGDVDRETARAKDVAQRNELKGKSSALQIAFDLEERNRKAFDKTFVDQLSSDAPDLSCGRRVAQEIDTIKAFFERNLDLFTETWHNYITEKGDLRNPDYSRIDPQKTLTNKRQMKDSEYRLDYIEKTLSKLIKKSRYEAVVARYNKLAEEKGWAKLKEDYRRDIILHQVSRHDKEQCAALYKIVFEELAKDPSIEPGFAKKITEKKLPHEYNLDEMQEYTMTGEINAVRAKIKGDKNEKAMSAILDEAARNLRKRTEEVYKHISEREVKDRVGSAISESAAKNLDTYMDGRYKDVFKSVNVVGKELKLDVIVPDKMDAALDFREQSAGFPDEHIDKIAAIVAKMKEYGMITGESEAEEGYKTYAHHQLVRDRVNIAMAVKEGDLAKIDAANKEMKKHTEQMREIYRMVKEAFPADLYAPSNLDTIRNGAVPIEFSFDFTTNSRVNGIFQAAELAERMKVDVRDMMKNSSRHIMNYYDKYIEEKGFDSIANKETSFLGAFTRLCAAGEDEAKSSTFAGKSYAEAPSVIVARAMDGFIMIGDDREQVLKAEEYRQTLVNHVKSAVDRESAYIQGLYVLTNADKKDLGEEKAKEVDERLKSAFLRGGPIRKSDLAMPLTLNNGMEVGNPNTYAGRLSERNRYKDIIKSYNDCRKVKYFEKKGAALIEEAMFDYLMAHPEDINKADFKALEKKALEAEEAFRIKRSETPAGSTPEPTIRDRYIRWRRKLVAEKERMEQEIRDTDIAVNKELERIQNDLAKAFFGKRFVEKAVKDKLLDEFETVIKNRMKDISNAVMYKEMTESYALKRIQNLAELRRDWKNIIKEPPKLVSTDDPEAAIRDSALINDRVNDRLWPGYLKNKDEYVKWRLSQKDCESMTREEIPEDEWDMSYHNAIRLQQLERPVFKEAPDIREETPEEIEQRRKKASVTELNNTFLDSLGVDLGLKTNRTKIDNPDALFEVMMKKLPSGFTMNNNLEKLGGNNFLSGFTKEFLTDIIALTVAHEIIRDNDGVVPKNKTIMEFAKYIGTSKHFKEAVEPYIDNIYKEYLGLAAEPEKQKDVAKYESFKALDENIRNKQIIRTAVMNYNKEQTKVHKEQTKEKQNENTTNRAADKMTDKAAEQPGIKA